MIKKPFVLTVEDLQNLPNESKQTILSYITVSEKIIKVTEVFRIAMSGNSHALLQQGLTDITTWINITKIYKELPYPTNYVLDEILRKSFPENVITNNSEH